MKKLLALCLTWVTVGFAAPAMAQAEAAVAPAPRVEIVTSMGNIVVELDPVHAPVSVANFLGYVRAHQYDGTIFHRVIDNFMIQGGGLTPKMKEKPTKAAIKNEAANGLLNKTGTIAMARETAVNSATSQFYINVSDNGFLDHVTIPPEGMMVTRHGEPTHVGPEAADQYFGYAVFGKVVSGMDVVEKIKVVPTHTVNGSENVPVEPVVIQKITLLP